MSVTSSLLRVICFVLMGDILINIVIGEDSTAFHNVTDYALQWKSGRSKRGIENMPGTLKIQIKYSTRELIDLKFTKRFQSIVNEHLPITLLSGNPQPNVMDHIGAISIYYDLRKCASVVYFETLDCFYGNIGVEYFIAGLPNKFDERGHYPEVVGAPYIIRRTNVPAHTRPSRPNPGMASDFVQSPDEFIAGLKRTLDSDSGPSNKRPRIKRDWNYGEMVNVSEIESMRTRRAPPESTRTFYAEILVFVTRGVIQKFESFPEFDNHIAWAVRYCIIFFAGIDMVFKRIDVRGTILDMNIAKIVLEDTSSTSIYTAKDGELDFGETVGKLRQYLGTHKNIYTPDSFDHVLMITSLPIRAGDILVSRMSEYHTDLFGARKSKRFYDAISITVVHLATDFGATAYEISRTWDIQTDSKDEGLMFSVQCYSIMQEGGPKCENCLKWSDNSKKQFAEFFRKSQKRCFLMNKPRSLNRPGPRVLFSAQKQCTCFGYASTTMLNSGPRLLIRTYECNIPLQCKRSDQSHYESTILPFDGSPCSIHNWVCWGGKCVNTKSGCN